MKNNRIWAAGLILTLLCGIFPSAPTLAAESARQVPFVDLPDPQMAEAAEFLRLMGVVDGTGDNAFTPDRVLTRAEFCKMAVELMGNGDKVAAQMNRTVFRDVPSTHWARGYINVATQVVSAEESSAPGIIRGDATGLFHPDRELTAAEAVTILMRVLGYSDSTVGFGINWYDGYMSAAASAGLTKGLSLAPTQTVTRGQTALLLYNLYFAGLPGGKGTYFAARGGKEIEDAIILNVNANADDGASGALETTKGKNKTSRVFDPSLAGRIGKVLLDGDGRALAFLPQENVSQRAVSVISTQATYLVASGGEKLTVEPETRVYREGKESTWKDSYMAIHSAAPVPVTFHYDANGKLAYLFFSSGSEEAPSSMVARSAVTGGTNPFAAMAGGGTYTMYKNGLAATAADIRQYDTATFDPAARVIQISDLKLTGIYEDASPSPSAPITVKVMGKADFRILPSARKDLEAFKIGDQITMLLTVDGDVAGVVAPTVVKGDAAGVASVSGGKATVRLLQGGLEVSGEVSVSAERYDGQLVTVSSSAKDRLSLSPISGSAARANLDVGARKLGDRDVAENVIVYDRVKGGDTVAVNYSDLTLAAVPRDKISFVAYDYAGRVRCMVLEDVTGNAYEYGYFFYEQGEQSGYNISPDTLCVRQATQEGGKESSLSDKGTFLGSIRNGVPGGVALTLRSVAGSSIAYRVAATVELKPLAHVGRSAFDPEEMTVTVGGVSYPISDKVQCRNKSTQVWLKPGREGMEAARAYSDNLTLYYDRAPAEGGKIRMIEIP